MDKADLEREPCAPSARRVTLERKTIPGSNAGFLVYFDVRPTSFVMTPWTDLTLLPEES